MRNKFSIVIIGICAFLTITFAFSVESFAKKRIVFGGGPAGGEGGGMGGVEVSRGGDGGIW